MRHESSPINMLAWVMFATAILFTGIFTGICIWGGYKLLQGVR